MTGELLRISRHQFSKTCIVAWREGKQKCCQCTNFEDFISADPNSFLLYVYPDEVSHHFRTVHKKKVTDEEGINCAKITHDIWLLRHTEI